MELTEEYKGHKFGTIPLVLNIIVVQDKESDSYTGWLEDYNGVIAEGNTLDELQINIKTALKSFMEI